MIASDDSAPMRLAGRVNGIVDGFTEGVMRWVKAVVRGDAREVGIKCATCTLLYKNSMETI